MNYQTRIAAEDRLLPGPVAPARRRRMLVIGIVLLLAIAIATWAYLRHGAAAAAAGAAPPAEQLPTVSVMMPGRSSVARTISATGTLAAKRDMPVGVAGEGGQVTRVLVEPGQWVRAGQVLAIVDRSVQVQQAASLASGIAVAQADYKLAQAQLDRAKQLVDRGFISRADIDTRTATRDAAFARVRVAQAQLAQQRATNGRLDIRAPTAGLILTRAVEPGQIVGAGRNA